MFDQKCISSKKTVHPLPLTKKKILRKKCLSSGVYVCYRGNAYCLWQESQVRCWTGMSHCSQSCYGPNLISSVLIALKAKFSLNFISFLSILIFYLREEYGVILILTRYECRSRLLLKVHINELSICQSYGS